MSSKPYVDPYGVLGLTSSATPAEIKQAYFTQVRNHPPERDPAMFKRIRAAYERLRDPESRAEVDMLLLRTWQDTARRRRVPKLDLTVHKEDVLAAAQSLSDLERTDWREHHEKVKL
jgi:curved DNA-binding protein CbpA